MIFERPKHKDMSTVFGVLKEGYRDLAGREEEIIVNGIQSIDGFEHWVDNDLDILFEEVARIKNRSTWFISPIAYLLPDSTPVFALDNVSDIKTIGEIRELIES